MRQYKIIPFRSLKHFYAQMLDGKSGKTVFNIASKGKFNAEELAKEFVDKAKKHKIDAAVFDRKGYRYSGKIKLFVEACRNQGLKI